MSKKVWVDADACPAAVKNILFRAADRLTTPLILVANQPMYYPKSKFITFIQAPSGPDEADKKIIEEVEAGELVITSDIPLAAEVIKKGALVLDFRGNFLTEENISEKLSMRNFMTNLRDSGIETGGPSSFSQRNIEAFANQLDKFFTKRK